MKTKYKLLSLYLAVSLILMSPHCSAKEDEHIKWVDFSASEQVLSDALKFCISAHTDGKEADFSEIIAYLGAKYGGNFKLYKKSDLEEVKGKNLSKATSNKKLFDYYKKAYGAVLNGLVGEYTEHNSDGTTSEGYGLRAYSPIANGFYYNHYDDFGASRSFGYKRNHLGHDLMGSTGTPIVCVESGYVEALGWNMYGGWRVGIRSFDGKRYYYYAHLRKGHPYNDLYEGKQVYGGEVIGYLGMTGYSRNPDTNNINVPHLHYGLQVIFVPEQKDGNNQIWIDMYALTNFLSKNKSTVIKGDDGEYCSLSYRVPKEIPD